MRGVGAFLRFWYEFLVGDDWAIALGVVLALMATRGLVRLHIDAWWLVPVAVVLLLTISLWRETGRLKRAQESAGSASPRHSKRLRPG
jgi:hypothetical protein